MKIGLKLLSTNTDYYFEETKRLYNEGKFDYIELYVVPETLYTIDKWAGLKIPFTLHAPHFSNGVNLADKSFEKENIRIFQQVKTFENTLNAEYVVIHSGIEGDIKETARQMKMLDLKNPLIENKPYLAPHANKKICRGAILEEIKYILNEVGCGFCLDIGHAFCTANSLDFEQYDYMAQFNELKPICYHLSGNFIDNEMDSHLHLYEGNIDLKRVFEIIDGNKNITIEAKRSNKNDLSDFEKDIDKIKSK